MPSSIHSVTFCVLLFGTAMYVLDNSEPESNTRNLLGQYSHDFTHRRDSLALPRWLLACLHHLDNARLRRYLSPLGKSHCSLSSFTFGSLARRTIGRRRVRTHRNHPIQVHRRRASPPCSNDIPLQHACDDRLRQIHHARAAPLETHSTRSQRDGVDSTTSVHSFVLRHCRDERERETNANDAHGRRKRRIRNERIARESERKRRRRPEVKRDQREHKRNECLFRMCVECTRTYLMCSHLADR